MKHWSSQPSLGCGGTGVITAAVRTSSSAVPGLNHPFENVCFSCSCFSWLVSFPLVAISVPTVPCPGFGEALLLGVIDELFAGVPKPLLHLPTRGRLELFVQSR